MTQGADEMSSQASPSGAHAPKPESNRGERRRGAFWTGLAAALGFGPGTRADTGGADVGTRLAHERTDLAVERSYLAAERTLMAWIRTALSMISFGFTIGKLGQTVEDVQVKKLLGGGLRMVSVESIAYFLVILGIAALLAAILQYITSVAEYTTMGLRRRVSIPVIVGLLLILVGGFALTALVMRL